MCIDTDNESCSTETYRLCDKHADRAERLTMIKIMTYKSYLKLNYFLILKIFTFFINVLITDLFEK